MKIKKIVLHFVILLSLLVSMELLLIKFSRAGTIKDDPFIGFSNLYPLFEKKTGADNSSYYETRKEKKRFFNLQSFQTEKSKNEFRIFVFGGSTVYGHPYDHTTSFSRFLEESLNALKGGDKVYRVINVGGISYASYRLIHLMKEMLNYNPDLFIVYSGHNEFLEDRTYPHLKNITDRRIKIQYYLNKLATYRLIKGYVLVLKNKLGIDAKGVKGEKNILPAEVTPILDNEGGIDLYQSEFSSDNAIYEHYRFNLQSMADISSKNNIPIVFMTLASNIKDVSPFKSYAEEKDRGILEKIKNNSEFFLKKDDADEALKELEEGLKKFPKSADLYYLRGQAFLKKGMISDASRDFITAKDIDLVPLRATTKINKIIKEVAHEKNKLLLDMEKIFIEKSADNIPGDDLFIDHCHPTLDGYITVAETILKFIIKEGIIKTTSPPDFDEISSLLKGIKSSLSEEYLANGVSNVGRVFNWAKKYKETVSRLTKELDNYPKSSEVHQFLGNAYKGLFEYDNALREYKTVLKIEPERADTKERISEIYFKTGSYDKTIAVLKEIITSEKATAMIHYNLALAYMKIQDYDMAERQYLKVLEKEPSMAKAYNNLGNLYKEKGEADKAKGMYDMALKNDNKLWNAHFNIGSYYFEKGEIENAIPYFQEVIKLNKKNIDAYRMLARIYAMSGDIKKAEEGYKQLIKVNSSPYTHKELGIFYAKNLSLDKAVFELKTALQGFDINTLNYSIPMNNDEDISFHSKELKTDKAEIHNALGNIYYMQSNYEEALSNYQTVKDINSEFPQISYNLGLSYFSLNRWDSAKEMFFLSYEKDKDNTEALYYLAVTEGRLGNIRKSVSLFEELIAQKSDHSLAYKDLGILYYFNLKDKYKGSFYLNKSIEISPNQPEAQNIKKLLGID